ncbi:dnaJ homolog subfamily C member 30, mitochondrial-like [Adelges cooleyi]|uniref:dnaJ homolog subfamily C member 30, mitochondrial-like n=1 Tax=Adelges cooleyi TaxID=133065 RepID=UPI002180923B|nr:dnaJ homolog subfamily C member 30, mitochondrial-like [Adelges cooleyi]XP_050442087.1 dnaJ homolog subfamily C member 30, mitochondrial-like [Adelges cooleyi]
MWTVSKALLRNNNLIKIHVANKTHYEALNLPNTATHKDIKDAYYRLSMMYHPDKNKGCENATKQFRDITAAYEILGNARQRRLYDLGSNIDPIPLKHHSQQPFKHMNSTNQVEKTHNTNHSYNFDQWSRSHYSTIVKRKNESEQWVKYTKMTNQYRDHQNLISVTVIAISLGLFILLNFVDLFLDNKSDYDNVDQHEKRK